MLAPLALWMHETSPGVGLVKGQRMRRRLEEIYSERHVASPQEAAQQLLRDARDHASLLLERGQGEYGFIHLTFQEYLAAMAIAQRGQSDLTPVVDLLASHIEDAAWHEVSLLTIGYMGIVQQRDEAAGQVLARLMAMRAGQPGAAVVLAGEAVVDTWPGGVTQQCRGVVTAALQQTMTDSANVAPAIRARAGSLVGALGDPRDLDAMVAVPAGAFLMGSNKKKDKLAYDDEIPQHTLTLPAFRIGKYPVTNGQYVVFVAATGHAAPSHWRGNQPPSELRNHPVVYVSWYDAVDYCAWLSQALGREMRLPTEAEWERAARHTDGRIYPWGNDFDAGRCNMADTGIGGTSPVGIFPAGDAVCGAADMAGNVWEWTSSLWGKDAGKPEFGYPYDPNDGRENLNAPDSVARVFRGGSFWDGARSVRCACRSWLYP